MIDHLNKCFLCQCAVIFALACVLFAGCAGTQVQLGPCSKYPCEWSQPVVKGKPPKLPAPDYTETAKAYLCLEPTRQYPMMLERTCI